MRGTHAADGACAALPTLGVPTQVLEILNDSTVRRLSEAQKENVAPPSQQHAAGKPVPVPPSAAKIAPLPAGV